MIDFITKQLSHSVTLVEVSGRLTDMDRSYFFDCISDLIESGVKHIVVDFQNLGAISSSGLAGLLMARKRVSRNGGRIYLTNLNSRIAELIEITRLGRILSVFKSPREAIANLPNSQACLN